MKKLTESQIFWMQKRAEEELQKKRKRRERIQGGKQGSDHPEPLAQALLKKQWPVVKFINKIVTKPQRNPFTRFSKEKTFAIPKVFSLIDNPDESLGVIAEIINAMNVQKNYHIFLDYRNCKFDYSAECLHTFLIHSLIRFKELKDETQPSMEGNFPSNSRLQRLMTSVGVASSGFATTTPNGVDQFQSEDDYRHFHKDSYEEDDVAFGSQDLKTRTVREFQNYLNDCLSMKGMQLSTEGADDIGEYVGEIIDNIEEHSNEKIWYVRGYLDKKLDHPYCELAIFNFGLTIYETFKKLPKDHFSREEIDPYVRKHLGVNGLTEENLYTVASLQDGWSSKNHSVTDTRGQGMTGLVEFFQELSDSCNQEKMKARLAIISGNTHIYFNGTNRLARDPQRSMKIIAMNSTNSLSDAPERQYVSTLTQAKFPGTLVAIRFPINPDHLSVDSNEPA